MKSILEVAKSLKAYSETEDCLKKNKLPIQINGCSESQFVHFVMSLAGSHKQKIIVTYDEKRARQISADLAFFDEKSYVYPAKDFIFYNADIHGNLLLKERMEAVRSVIKGERATIVTTPDAFMDYLLSYDRVKKDIISRFKFDNILLNSII